MKKILLIITILISCTSYGQLTVPVDSGYRTFNLTGTTFSGFRGGYFGVETVISTYDTVTLYKGDEKCNHNFVSEIKPIFNISCAVNYNAAGCPDNWLNEKQICTICLKHIQVKETRTVKKKEDAYTEALNRLTKKLQN